MREQTHWILPRLWRSPLCGQLKSFFFRQSSNQTRRSHSNTHQISILPLDGIRSRTVSLLQRQQMIDLFTKHVRHSIVSLLPNGTTHIHALDFFFNSQHQSLGEYKHFSSRLYRSFPTHPTLHQFIGGATSCRGSKAAGPPIIHAFFLGFRPPLESYLENSACNLISHPGLSRCSIGTVEGEI